MSQSFTAAASEWALQATAPLPLEAVNDLVKIAINGNHPASPLVGTKIENFVWVNEDFFKSKPSGISSTVGPDVLGFLSLVLTYAKSADKMTKDKSAKELSSFMPRTNFVTMYGLVKDQIAPKLKGSSGLYDLVKTLACYENFRHDVNDIDTMQVLTNNPKRSFRV